VTPKIGALQAILELIVLSESKFRHFQLSRMPLISCHYDQEGDDTKDSWKSTILQGGAYSAHENFHLCTKTRHLNLLRAGPYIVGSVPLGMYQRTWPLRHFDSIVAPLRETRGLLLRVCGSSPYTDGAVLDACALQSDSRLHKLEKFVQNQTVKDAKTEL